MKQFQIVLVWALIAYPSVKAVAYDFSPPKPLSTLIARTEVIAIANIVQYKRKVGKCAPRLCAV